MRKARIVFRAQPVAGLSKPAVTEKPPALRQKATLEKPPARSMRPRHRKRAKIQKRIPAVQAASAEPEETTEAPAAPLLPPTLTLETPPPLPTRPLEEKSSVDLGAYGRRLQQSIGEHKRYPRAAKRFGMQGQVLVQVAVNRHGQLVKPPSIHRSSGHSLLDEEALRMVKSASPFAQLPADFTAPSAIIVVPIRFELHG